jgi:hypothetical protein
MFLPPRPFFFYHPNNISVISAEIKVHFYTIFSAFLLFLSYLHHPKLSVPSDHSEVQAGDLVSICYLFLLNIHFGTVIKQMTYFEGLLLPSRTNH